MRTLLTIFTLFLLTSCVSRTKYVELAEKASEKDSRIEQLQQEVYAKDAYIADLENYARNLEVRVNRSEARANSLSSSMMNARQNLNQAEFWGQAGSDFLSNTHYNNAKRDLNNMDY